MNDTKDANLCIFMANLATWIRTNAKKDDPKNRNFHEGRFWSYNSIQEFVRYFGFWSTKNIRTIIANCIKLDLIATNSFNKKKYDNTLWYTLTDKGLEYYPCLRDFLSNMLADSGKGLADSGNAIPEDLNHKTKPYSPLSPSATVSDLEKQYFEKWNELAKKEGLSQIRLKNKEHIKKCKRQLTRFLSYWPELNSDPTCKINDDYEMHPDYLIEILEAGIAAKSFILSPDRDPYRTFEIILRQNNFEKMLQEINQRLR